jgi:hypothetical protein
MLLVSAHCRIAHHLPEGHHMRSFRSSLHGQFALTALVMVTASPLARTQAARDVDQGVIGKWHLVTALDSADINSLDEQGAQQLVGKIFIISKKTVKVGTADDCLPPGFEAKIVEPEWYVRKWAHASAKHLGLPGPVTVVDLGCTNAFIKSPTRIVVFWKGWFFDAKRIR